MGTEGSSDDDDDDDEDDDDEEDEDDDESSKAQSSVATGADGGGEVEGGRSSVVDGTDDATSLDAAATATVTFNGLSPSQSIAHASQSTAGKTPHPYHR